MKNSKEELFSQSSIKEASKTGEVILGSIIWKPMKKSIEL
jgi:hypothetical protein